MLRRSYQICILAVVIISLAVAAYLTANVAMTPWSPFVSGISLILFAVPCFWAAKMWLGWRDATFVFVALGVFALLLESAAITTGFPYGRFEYGNHLGYKLFGVVPWPVAFAWTPLLLGAYAIAAGSVTSRTLRMVGTAFILMALDFVIDPGAVRLGFWRYAEGGPFYGVPLSNFAGWLFTGFLGAGLLELILSRIKPLLPAPVQLASSAVLIIFFWTVVAASSGLIVPALIGILTLVSVAVAWRRFHYHFDDKIVFVDEANRPIGTATKAEAHNSDTQLHRAFSAFIFNRRGELLLQQRALSKKTWPGVWSNSCCGHVMLHEATQKAAARRLSFELGLQRIDLVTALPEFRYRAEKEGVVENEICPVLIGVTDDIPSPNPTEVADIKWVAWNNFLASLEEPGNEISPWAVEEVRLLQQSEVFRKWFSRVVTVSGTNGSVC